LLENRLAHETGKRANHTPPKAELPERCTEILDPSLSGKNDVPSRSLSPCGKPRELTDMHRNVRCTHCEKELTIPRKGVVCGPLSRFVRVGHTGTPARCEIIL
jgi:hypothetical protein